MKIIIITFYTGVGVISVLQPQKKIRYDTRCVG